jgi:hypothetical protein
MLDPENQGGSTAGFVRKIWNGDLDKIKGAAPRKLSRLTPHSHHDVNLTICDRMVCGRS